MPRHSSDQLSVGSLLGWGAAGFVTGFVAAAALAEWTGDLNRDRLGRMARRLRTPAPRAGRPGNATRAAEDALGREPDLRELELEALPAGRGGVELRGWVPSRRLRARAARVVAELPGVEAVVNRILVRGEDDRPPEASRADQTA